MPANPTFESINELVYLFLRQHFMRMHQLFHEIGVYRGQPQILHFLSEREGCTQTELASALQITPATMTKTLQRMEQAQRIERRPDSTDQRVTRVYLTDAGREIRQAIKQRERQASREMLEGFTPQELSVLAGFLERMRANLMIANRGEALDPEE